MTQYFRRHLWKHTDNVDDLIQFTKHMINNTLPVVVYNLYGPNDDINLFLSIINIGNIRIFNYSAINSDTIGIIKHYVLMQKSLSLPKHLCIFSNHKMMNDFD